MTKENYRTVHDTQYIGRASDICKHKQIQPQYIKNLEYNVVFSTHHINLYKCIHNMSITK